MRDGVVSVVEAMERAMDGVMMDEMETQPAGVVERPVLAGGDAAAGAGAGAGGGFADAYLRRGVVDGLEVKALTTLNGPDGGFAVPETIDRLIGAALVDKSPMRTIARVIETGTSGYRKLIATGRVASGWVTETGPRPGTATPQMVEIKPPVGELYANPAASQQMLDDAAFDVERWLADEIAGEFARAEGQAFIKGTGDGQPLGLVRAATTPERDAQRAPGVLQHVATGDGDGLGEAADDRLIELVHALRAPYRQGAVFVMNSQTLAQVRRLRTPDGQFVWQPGLVAGQAATLLGHRVVEDEAMPDIAPGALPIAFGDFQAGYVIVDRGRTVILRDPYSNKPFVHFYATRRVGGSVVDGQAIKFLKIAAA